MTIHELLALTGLTESDEIPVWDAEASGEPTKKITAQNFAAAIKTLASLLGTSDVVNDLTSAETQKPGSANMLRVLNEAIAQSTASDWGNVSSWMSDAERGSCDMSYFGNVLEVSFMTNGRVHAENDVIMTLPESWRPRFNVDIPAFYRNGCCVLRIQPSGVMIVWLLNDTTNTGRIYGHFTLAVP